MLPRITSGAIAAAQDTALLRVVTRRRRAAQALGVGAGEVDRVAAGEDRPGEGIGRGRLERGGGDDDGAMALGVNDDHHARMIHGAYCRVDVDALGRATRIRSSTTERGDHRQVLALK